MILMDHGEEMKFSGFYLRIHGKMYSAERYLFHLDLVRRWYGLNMDKTLLSDCF